MSLSVEILEKFQSDGNVKNALSGCRVPIPRTMLAIRPNRFYPRRDFTLCLCQCQWDSPLTRTCWSSGGTRAFHKLLEISKNISPDNFSKSCSKGGQKNHQKLLSKTKVGQKMLKSWFFLLFLYFGLYSCISQ